MIIVGGWIITSEPSAEVCAIFKSNGLITHAGKFDVVLCKVANLFSCLVLTSYSKIFMIRSRSDKK